MAAPAKSEKVLLAIYEKQTSPVDLYKPLKGYICRRICKKQAEDVEEDLQAVKRMRNDLQQTEVPFEARLDLLIRYFRALCAMELRFPISSEKEDVNSITFTWWDAFKQSKKASQRSIHFEKAGVLFNIAAVHSQIALSADRTTPAGLKQACNSFQASGGVFAFLRENVSMKASMGPSTVDVSAESAAMLEKFMLAQAQECFFEKVIADGKPPGLCAKLAKQVGLYYEEAYAALNRQTLNQHFDKTWIAHVRLKAAQFNAEACNRVCMELHEKEEIAEEIARLQIAVASLAGAKKSAKGVVAESLLYAVKLLEANLKRDLERANKENSSIFLMRIPPSSSLSPIPYASLVQSTPMNETFDASKEKIFARLVTETSAKVVTRYTEMVDEIISTQAAKLRQQSDLITEKLKEMKLSDFILVLEGNFKIPDDIEKEVEAELTNGCPSGTEAELRKLSDRRRVNQELLVQTDELLQKEIQKDIQLESLGMRWSKPHSALTNLSDKLSKFAGNLKQAEEGDAKIEQAVRDNSSLMAILETKPLLSVIPNNGRPIMTLDGSFALGALKESQKQLETLGAQGKGLEDKLKDMKIKDDILPKVAMISGSHDDLLNEELGKYDSICQEIAQNIDARQQLLLKIQEQKDKLSTVCYIEDHKDACEKSCKQIATAAAKFREIKGNIDEGLKFYDTIKGVIEEVKRQCSDYATTRDTECQKMTEDMQRPVAEPNSTDWKTGIAYPSVPEQHAQFGAQQVHPPHLPHPPAAYYYPAVPPSAGFVPPVFAAQPPPVYQQQYGHYPPPQIPQMYGQPPYAGWQVPYNGYHAAPLAPPPPCPHVQAKYPSQPGVPYYMNQ